MRVVDEFEEVPHGSETILIVDDDPIQRRVTGSLLNRLGYRIRVVPSGEQALEIIRQEPQDLLILDMIMDGMDGTETYRKVLEIRPDQKAIMLSGYAKSRRVERALKLGAGSFVAKPVSLKSLATAVRKELDS